MNTSLLARCNDEGLWGRTGKRTLAMSPNLSELQACERLEEELSWKDAPEKLPLPASTLQSVLQGERSTLKSLEPSCSKVRTPREGDSTMKQTKEFLGSTDKQKPPVTAAISFSGRKKDRLKRIATISRIIEPQSTQPDCASNKNNQLLEMVESLQKSLETKNAAIVNQENEMKLLLLKLGEQADIIAHIQLQLADKERLIVEIKKQLDDQISSTARASTTARSRRAKQANKKIAINDMPVPGNGIQSHVIDLCDSPSAENEIQLNKANKEKKIVGLQECVDCGRHVARKRGNRAQQAVEFRDSPIVARRITRSMARQR